LLFVLGVWMSWSKRAFGPSDPASLSPTVSLAIFFGGYLALVAGIRLWALWVVRRSNRGFVRGLYRLQNYIQVARYLIPIWLAVGVYILKWGEAVEFMCHPLYNWPPQSNPTLQSNPIELPQALIGIAPAILAWVGMWWSYFPCDEALREQSLFGNLNDDLPIHAPPTFAQSFGAKLRLQVMFTLVPVLCVLFVHDLAVAGLYFCGVHNGGDIADWLMIPATIAVFIYAPELLRRALSTQKLPDSPLRRRLEEMCRRLKLRYRDILLWRTGDTMGNAAVMGVLPRVRYVLLSDLLLETMTDEQIEAVFAHELGHVVHKHLIWLGVYILLTVLLITGPETYALQFVHNWYVGHWSAASWDNVEGLLDVVIAFAAIILAFGYLSPRFERQADVFAARTMQQQRSDPQGQTASFVDEYGAGLFASALQRVAIINHVPFNARNWSHGSIAKRVSAVLEMSADPQRTWQFDRFMTRLYITLIILLLCGGAVCALMPAAAFTAGR
jgi:STE24 endopeptidase